MAMVHPDDLGFSRLEPVSHASMHALFLAELGLAPLRITSPTESQGEYHKLYFVKLELKGDSKWSGEEVVLRVARPAFNGIKVRNEVGALHLVRGAGVPAPEVIFWSDTTLNTLGYEYIAMESSPDIERYFNATPYNLHAESHATLNPTGPFSDWTAYISAFLKSYAHIIDIHPSVTHLRPLLPPLNLLIADLDAPLDTSMAWIQKLRQSPSLLPHLWHCDLHLANLLGNANGDILGVIDWEFAAFRASFYRKSSPIRNLIAALPDDPTLSTWPELFLSTLKAKEAALSKDWEAVTNMESVLGKEGLALSSVREQGLEELGYP
ncbi:hypothetical protein RQP46_002297 [Phenoliferia psychrophenolica]